MPLSADTLFHAATVILLSLFLPVTAATYYKFRHYRRAKEIERVLNILKVDKDYRHVHQEVSPGVHYLVAVIYASALAIIGLILMFYADGVGLEEFPSLKLGEQEYPRPGSRMVFAMAFIGGYLWGLQHVFRRYALNDLVPVVYYSLSLRMLVAATLALVIFNAYGALVGTDANTATGITVWPAIAFLIGMFPRRGLRWLTDKTPIFSADVDPSVKPAPLEMIQGMSLHDRLRLEEVGIDNCYDLANYDFVPLILKTPYGARELIDWILQAKLCTYVGEGVKDLRHHGIRTIVDLEQLKDMETLIAESAVTRDALERARDSVVGNVEIRRMQEAGALLGTYWKSPAQQNATPASD